MSDDKSFGENGPFEAILTSKIDLSEVKVARMVSKLFFKVKGTD